MNRLRLLSVIAMPFAGLFALGAACHTDAGAPGRAAAPAPAMLSAAPDGKGTVGERRFHSAALGVDKQYRVYLPAGYQASTRRYPVVYLLHGLGGDQDNWLAHGDLAATADKLKLQAIVVMPDGDASFYANAATPADWDACQRGESFLADEPREQVCVHQGAYEDYIVRDLIADVEAQFRAVPDRRGRAISGMSMGGFGALSLAMRHPDLFASAASHSGVDALLYAGPHPYDPAHVVLATDVSRWGAEVEPIGSLVRGIFGPDLAQWQAHDPAYLAGSLVDGALAIYLDCGTEDDFALQDGASYLHDILTRRGVKHAFTLLPGRHDSQFWRGRIDDSLAFHAAVFSQIRE